MISIIIQRLLSPREVANVTYPQSRVQLLITSCVEVTGSVFQLLSSVTELLTVMTDLMRWGVLNIVSFILFFSCHFVSTEYCKFFMHFVNIEYCKY